MVANSSKSCIFVQYLPSIWQCCGKKLPVGFCVLRKIYIFAPAFSKNDCLTNLLIKNESLRDRFHFDSRFV